MYSYVLSMEKVYNGMFYAIVLTILFLLNPTIALALSFISVCVSKSPSKLQYSQFIIFLAAWLGVVNMTKEPASDQIYYAWIYEAASSKNFVDGILNYRPDMDSVKELFFNVFSVVCNRICSGNTNGYFFLLTFTIYVLHFAAILKVFKAMNLSKMEILCAIILLAFFSPFFMQSIHACRQILASAFLIYALAYRCVNKKNNWLLLILAFLSHNTSLVFIIFSIVPQFLKKWSIRDLLLISLCFIGFVTFYAQIGNSIGSIGSLGAFSEVGRRLASVNDAEKDLFSLVSLLIYSVPMLICSIKLLWEEYTRGTTALLPIIYTCAFTFLFIISFSFAPTIQFRYMFYLYSFFPFMIIPFMRHSCRIVRQLYCISVTAFFSLRFFFYDNWGWEYAPLFETIQSSFITIWNTTYYIV